MGLAIWSELPERLLSPTAKECSESGSISTIAPERSGEGGDGRVTGSRRHQKSAK